MRLLPRTSSVALAGLPGIEQDLGRKAPLPRRDGNVWTPAKGRGDAWIYMRLPEEPLLWASEQTQHETADRLLSLFAALTGREVHLLALRWDEAPTLPKDTPTVQRELLDPIFGSWSRLAGLCAVGVRLPSGKARQSEQARVEQMLTEAGARPLTGSEAARVEGWWTGGSGRAADVVPLDVYPEGIALHVPANTAVLNGSGTDCAMWLAELLAHDGSLLAVSVRGTAAAPAGDDTSQVGLGHGIRLRRCSIVFASRQGRGSAGLDGIEHRYGIKAMPVRSDVDAIAETAPLGRPRVGVPQIGADLDALTLAVSGITAHNSPVGDRCGVWVGTSVPEFDPVWVGGGIWRDHPGPPLMAVIGDPGCGKTFLMRWAALQTARRGLPAVVVNPQTADSYAWFCDRVGGTLNRIQVVGDGAGALDPFRFAEGAAAAEILTDHITACVTLSDDDTLRLRMGLRAAAESGARCATQALTNAAIPAAVLELVTTSAAANTLLALAISPHPLPTPTPAAAGRVQVLEFSHVLRLSRSTPADREERSAVAAVRLAVRAALEQVITAGGGLVAIDAADAWSGESEISWLMERLNHAAGYNTLLMAAFQRASSLPSGRIGPGSYLGRVMAMQATDPAEADAVLALCGLPADDPGRSFLSNAGPVIGREHPIDSRRGALGLYRDLDGRVAAMLVGPFPETSLRQLADPPLAAAAGF